MAAGVRVSTTRAFGNHIGASFRSAIAASDQRVIALTEIAHFEVSDLLISRFRQTIFHFRFSILSSGATDAPGRP